MNRHYYGPVMDDAECTRELDRLDREREYEEDQRTRDYEDGDGFDSREED